MNQENTWQNCEYFRKEQCQNKSKEPMDILIKEISKMEATEATLSMEGHTDKEHTQPEYITIEMVNLKICNICEDFQGK